jgi:hypothetical protein
MYSDSSQKKNTQNSEQNMIPSNSNKKNDQFLTEQYHQFSYGNRNSIEKNKFEDYPIFKKNA